VQLSFDAEVEAFRAEFVSFLDEHLPTEAQAADRPSSTSHDGKRDLARRPGDQDLLCVEQLALRM
jgi:hypothetical protein